jgi:hypothetical protein
MSGGVPQKWNKNKADSKKIAKTTTALWRMS